MIGRSKGENINDAIQGPVGYLGAGIIVIAVIIAIANDWDAGVTAPDEAILFGGFIADLIIEIKFYMFAIVPLILIGGGFMVALQLKIHPHKKSMKGDSWGARVETLARLRFHPHKKSMKCDSWGARVKTLARLRFHPHKKPTK